MKTDIVKLVVEIASFGMSSDEFDKETRSSDGLQSKQADLSCVHALNKLHLHEIHVVPTRFSKKARLTAIAGGYPADDLLHILDTLQTTACDWDSLRDSIMLGKCQHDDPSYLLYEEGAIPTGYMRVK
ncbi:hypothetical protein Tco_0573110 [Tanacetum coccineum]